MLKKLAAHFLLPYDQREVHRYELKFLISEATYSEIYSYISCLCEPDNTGENVDGKYTVHSLYFDTPDFQFYADTQIRVPTRIKPRARYFGGAPKDVVWLELKKRNRDMVWKKRIRATLEYWPEVLYRSFPPPSERRIVELSNIQSYEDSFLNAINSFRAVPSAHVRYEREAYMSQVDTYARITFDRKLRGCLANGDTNLFVEERDLICFDDPATCDHPDSPVILEIKAEALIPKWIIHMIQDFGLQRRGFSKYCNTIRTSMDEQPI